MLHPPTENSVGPSDGNVGKQYQISNGKHSENKTALS